MLKRVANIVLFALLAGVLAGAVSTEAVAAVKDIGQVLI